MEKKYRSGAERYGNLTNKIKQVCSNLDGKIEYLYAGHRTRYNYNGLDICIYSDNEVTITNSDGTMELTVYTHRNFENSKEMMLICQFDGNLLQKPDGPKSRRF